MFDFLKKKKEEKKPFLSEADKLELLKLERESYMEEAKKLIPLKAKDKAKKDYGVMSKEEEWLTQS